MSSFEDLLKLRRTIKKRKSKAIRQDFHKKKRLKKKWRRPKGIHSKIRLNKAGHRKKNKVGYKSPKAVHSLHKSGLKIILVHSFNDIKDIDKDKEGMMIAKGVGLKKKVELIKKMIEANLTILNIKKPDEYLKKVEDALKIKKEEKEKKKQIKEKKVKEKEKKSKEKEEKKGEKKEELTEKIEKEEEKKEKDKLLTKRV